MTPYEIEQNARRRQVTAPNQPAAQSTGPQRHPGMLGPLITSARQGDAAGVLANRLQQNPIVTPSGQPSRMGPLQERLQGAQDRIAATSTMGDDTGVGMQNAQADALDRQMASAQQFSSPTGFSPAPGIVTRGGVTNVVGQPTDGGGLAGLDASIAAKRAAEEQRRATVAGRVQQNYAGQVEKNAPIAQSWGYNPDGGNSFIGGKRYIPKGEGKVSGMVSESIIDRARRDMTPEQLERNLDYGERRQDRVDEARSRRQDEISWEKHMGRQREEVALRGSMSPLQRQLDIEGRRVDQEGDMTQAKIDALNKPMSILDVDPGLIMTDPRLQRSFADTLLNDASGGSDSQVNTPLIVRRENQQHAADRMSESLGEHEWDNMSSRDIIDMVSERMGTDAAPSPQDLEAIRDYLTNRMATDTEFQEPQKKMFDPLPSHAGRSSLWSALTGDGPLTPEAVQQARQAAEEEARKKSSQVRDVYRRAPNIMAGAEL